MLCLYESFQDERTLQKLLSKVMLIHLDLDVCLSLTFVGFPYAYLSAKFINKKLLKLISGVLNFGG